MRYQVPLVAGQPRRLPHAGRVLQLVDTGVAATVALDVEWPNGHAESYGDVTNKFKLRAADAFAAIVLQAGVNCTIDVLISQQDVTVNQFDGTSLQATVDPAQLPLPVKETEDLAVIAATYPAAVAVTAAGQQLMAANAAAKRVTLYNAGPNSVAIFRGAAGAASFTTAALVLPIGGMFIEERFAGTPQAWRAICAAAQTATVQIEVQQ